MDPQKAGNAIKVLRMRAGYTQKTLAERLNITDKAVSKWERGLSAPDISILTKLAILLNCDVDSLLDGNVTYLEKHWKGLLLLKENQGIFSCSQVYGKPLVYLLLSYFLLAGIGEIYISCPERDRRSIEDRMGDGSEFGFQLLWLDAHQRVLPTPSNTMVVYDNPFLYGANLTKYFQRAMTRLDGISVLTAQKKSDGEGMRFSYTGGRAERQLGGGGEQCCVPVVFFPKLFSSQISSVEDTASLTPLYAEPMGNGTVAYCVTDADSLLDTSLFLRYMKNRMGINIYDLREVARNRGFIH